MSSARAMDDFIMNKFGWHDYTFPRNILQMIYESGYGRIPNANPDWSHDSTVRLLVQWPNFGLSPERVAPKDNNFD